MTTTAHGSTATPADTREQAIPGISEYIAALATARRKGRYTLTFGGVGTTRPVPPLTLDYQTRDQFTRAVADHAIPYLRPALEAAGRPELADCIFRADRDLTRGEFWRLDLRTLDGARFCPTRIEAAG